MFQVGDILSDNSRSWHSVTCLQRRKVNLSNNQETVERGKKGGKERNREKKERHIYTEREREREREREGERECMCA